LDLDTQIHADGDMALFSSLLGKVKAIFDESEVWHPPIESPEDILKFINEGRCNEFHRVWSALQFIDCLPPKAKYPKDMEKTMTTEELFGDGLYWGACAIMALLGQQKRFEALDISFYLRDVIEHTRDIPKDKKAKSKKDDTGLVETSVGSISLQQLSKRICYIKMMTTQIFDKLQMYMDKGSGPESYFHEPYIHHFQPPAYVSQHAKEL